MIRVDPRSIASIDGIRRSLLRLVPDLHADVTAEAAQAALEAAQIAADKHTRPASEGGGRLVRSLKLRKLGGFNSNYEIYHDLQMAPHAVFVHWGTRAHIIKPKDKKALRWAGPNGFVFAKIVHHPGYKGDPYLVNARSSVVRGFTRIASQSWANITKRLFG